MNLKTIYSSVFTLFLVIPFISSSQNFQLSGKVLEKETIQPVIGASITLKKEGKTIGGTASDGKGLFRINKLAADTYQITFTYVGLKTKTQQVIIGSDRFMGAVVLEKNINSLEEIKIEGSQIRVEQKGDTTSINAGAYKVNQDATAEDLVKKMPGITIENGTVKAQGEDVKKILVDGKEFFGDDANMALKNLPAEIIDKVQVFNRASDQAQFTGFNDGNTDKTMNITTKTGRNNGTFGKLYAGYGTNDRYQAGGNMNFFKGDRRITVLGLSNNVNQQNFSMQDLFGGSAGGGRMPMGGRGGPRGGGGMGGAMSDFMIGQQNGVSTTQSIGLNYADKWGAKTNVSGSYFFNNSSTITNQLSNRIYLIDQETKQFYRDSTGSETNNYNNRFNLRLEHAFDSSHAIIYTPKISFQSNENSSNQLAENTVNDTLLNRNLTAKTPLNTGFNVSNNLLYRYKFEKPGRTISLNVIHDINRRNSDTKQFSEILAIDSANRYNNNIIRQQSLSYSNSNNYNANLTFTENLTDSTQLQLSYNPIINHNLAERATNRFDTSNREYSRIDTLLSNNFDNTIITHRANVSININKAKWKLNLGVTQQYLTIASLQSFPETKNFEKRFQNLLPNANFTYNFSNAKTFRFFYRTNTNNPSVTQLQNVIDNTNPVMLSAGNPNLKQEFSQTLLTRYGSNNWHNSQSFFVFAMVTFTDDYIANSTFTATRDSVLENGVLLGRGAQIARPVNLSGNINARSFLTYGMPIKAIKSNVNLNLGVNYTKVPGLVNQLQNFANTFNINSGIVIGSNISEQVDFTLSHTSNINLVTNTVFASQNNNFFINTSNLKVNIMPTTSWVIQSDINYTNFAGLGSDFNQSFFLWNAGVAYKFMKRMAEVKLSVFDLMNQNNNINRTVTETYIEDTRSNVLNRYYMLTFTYNIRKFKSVGK
jgi:hypothetical protein